MDGNSVAEIKEKRKDAVFFYTKGQDVKTISRRLGISEAYTETLLHNYLRHEGKISPNYIVPKEQRSEIKTRLTSLMKNFTLEDISMVLLIPEGVLCKILHTPEPKADSSWITSCAYNFRSFGYLECEIRMPSGTDKIVNEMIIDAMRSISDEAAEKGAMYMIKPQLTSASAVKPDTPAKIAEPAKNRGLKTAEDIQNHIEVIRAFLRQAYAFEDKKASEIAYIGKYYLLGNDSKKIAGLMAMDKDLAGVEDDLKMFLAAEERLAHPEKQANDVVKKPMPKPASPVKYVNTRGKDKAVPTDPEALIADYQSGMALKDIQKKYPGVTQPTIYEILKAHHVALRKPSDAPSPSNEEISKLYKAGVPIDEIAKKVGISKAAIYKRMQSCGIARRHVYASTYKPSTTNTEHAVAKPVTEPVKSVPAKTNRADEKFGSMDFFLDTYLVIASIPGVTALDFMRWMLAIEDSKSAADKSAVARKMVSVIATSKDPEAIDVSKLQSTVETYIEASSALAQL